MCCLLTFHGVMGRLSHCCIKGKHLYRKNDVKNPSFATVFVFPQSDLLTLALLVQDGLQEGLVFLQSQQFHKIELDFFLPAFCILEQSCWFDRKCRILTPADLQGSTAAFAAAQLSCLHCQNECQKYSLLTYKLNKHKPGTLRKI